MAGHEAGWRNLLWSGPVPGCCHPREGSRERWRGQGQGRALQLVGGGGPRVENVFPNPIALGQEGAPLPLLGSCEYRSELQSMLQTWLIAGLGQLGEQAKPAEWARREPRAWYGAGTCSPERPPSPEPWWGRPSCRLHREDHRPGSRWAAGASCPRPVAARSGGNLPIQTGAGQSGPGAPAGSNARCSRPQAPAAETLARGR